MTFRGKCGDGTAFGNVVLFKYNSGSGPLKYQQM